VIVDTHCHLDQFDDPAAVLREAAAHGVSRVVAMSQDIASMKAVACLRRSYPHAVVAALGLHPATVVEQSREQTEDALTYLADHLIDADVLGEVGLDYKWADTDDGKLLQAATLDRQLALAAACGKPINLHSRRCPRQVMERAIAFHQETGLNAQLHWFTESKKLIAICNDAGIFVSVGPSILDRPETLSVAATVADELLLLETDAPVPIGGQPGHPCRARQVAERLTALKGVCLEEIAEVTSANFSRYLGAD
jgi:TatD DNase family protein